MTEALRLGQEAAASVQFCKFHDWGRGVCARGARCPYVHRKLLFSETASEAEDDVRADAMYDRMMLFWQRLFEAGRINLGERMSQEAKARELRYERCDPGQRRKLAKAAMERKKALDRRARYAGVFFGLQHGPKPVPADPLGELHLAYRESGVYIQFDLSDASYMCYRTLYQAHERRDRTIPHELKRHVDEKTPNAVLDERTLLNVDCELDAFMWRAVLRPICTLVIPDSPDDIICMIADYAALLPTPLLSMPTPVERHRSSVDIDPDCALARANDRQPGTHDPTDDCDRQDPSAVWFYYDDPLASRRRPWHHAGTIHDLCRSQNARSRHYHPSWAELGIPCSLRPKPVSVDSRHPNWVAHDPLDFAIALFMARPERLYHFRTRCWEVHCDAPMSGERDDDCIEFDFSKRLQQAWPDARQKAQFRRERHLARIDRLKRRLSSCLPINPRDTLTTHSDRNKRRHDRIARLSQLITTIPDPQLSLATELARAGFAHCEFRGFGCWSHMDQNDGDSIVYRVKSPASPNGTVHNRGRHRHRHSDSRRQKRQTIRHRGYHRAHHQPRVCATAQLPDVTRPLPSKATPFDYGGDPYNPVELHFSDAERHDPLYYVPFVAPRLLPLFARSVSNAGNVSQCEPPFLPLTQERWRDYLSYALCDRFHLLPFSLCGLVASIIADYVMVLLWEPAYQRWRLRAEELYDEWRHDVKITESSRDEHRHEEQTYAAKQVIAAEEVLANVDGWSPERIRILARQSLVERRVRLRRTLNPSFDPTNEADPAVVAARLQRQLKHSASVDVIASRAAICSSSYSDDD